MAKSTEIVDHLPVSMLDLEALADTLKRVKGLCPERPQITGNLLAKVNRLLKKHLGEGDI
jgi:hypothetical protein